MIYSRGTKTNAKALLPDTINYVKSQILAQKDTCNRSNERGRDIGREAKMPFPQDPKF